MDFLPHKGKELRIQNAELKDEPHGVMSFRFCALTCRGGFTLIELLVSISIFVIMTILLIVKYGNFNQSVLLTDTAYDVATTIRTAQTYGVGVVNEATTTNVTSFQYPYGADFATGPGVGRNQKIILFEDVHSVDHIYVDSGMTQDQAVATYTIKRGAVVSGICVGDGPGLCNTTAYQLSITFKRPDPDALIYIGSDAVSMPTGPYNYAEVTIKATDGSTRVISVRKNGQISVQN